MKKISAKHRILEILIDAQFGRQYYYYGQPLPIGYVPTGVLHSPEIAGTSARTRISELNKSGFQIESGLLTRDRLNRPLRDKDGNHAHVYVYRLLTPGRLVDVKNITIRQGERNEIY